MTTSHITKADYGLLDKSGFSKGTELLHMGGD